MPRLGHRLGNDMTLLTPIPALIAAAIALPLLVVYYLLKLRRRPLRISSTLLWTTAVRDLQANVPLRWLRPSWLLLLQLLALILLLLAMARPAIDMPDAPPERVIVMLDLSASMSATDAPGGQSRFEEAKDRAVALLDGLGGGAMQAMLVTFAGSATAATPFTSDLGAIKEALRAADPTDQPADAKGAFELVGAIIAGEGGEGAEEAPAARTLVAVLSDGTFAGGRAYAIPGADVRFERVGPRGGVDNLGIVAIAARRDYENPARVRLFARILNAGPAAISTAVSLSIDGQEVRRAPLSIEGTKAGGPPAEGVATLEFDHRGGGVATLRIERTDSLASDSTAALVLDPPARPRIVLVVPDGGATDAPEEAEGWRIADVLASMDPLSLRTLRARLYETMAASGALGEVDLIVFDRIHPTSAPPCPSMSFAASLGEVSYVAPPTPTMEPVVSWLRTHPIMRDVALDAVIIEGPGMIDAPDDDSSVKTTELATGRAGPLIVLRERGRLRRLFVGFDLARSNWWLGVSFPIFMANALDALTMRGEDSAGRAVTTLEPVEIDRAEGARSIEVSGPSSFTVEVPGPGTSVSLGALARAGVYELEGASARAVAANLVDPIESSIAVADSIVVGGESRAGAAAGSGPREIWAWCVLAVGLLLMVEWVLSAFLSRA